MKEDPLGGLALRIPIRIHKDHKCLNAVDLLTVMRNGHTRTVAVIPCTMSLLKARDHGYAHARRLSLQNKFVGSTLNSKSPLLVQSLKILRSIPTSVALAGLVIPR